MNNVRDNEECIKDGEILVDALIMWNGSLNGKSDRFIRNHAELMTNGKFIDALTRKNS